MLARSVIFATNDHIDNKKTIMAAKLHRRTTNLDDDLNAELDEVEQRTGVSAAEVLRQGAIRVMNEYRQTGQLVFKTLVQRESDAAAA